jgi:16S rRNA (guanine527-N7)-methyltransferase
LTEPDIELLHRHYEYLERWNQVLNLSSIRDLETAVVRHYCESLFLALNLPGVPLNVVDVGSGAGFPGVPLAILRPDCTVSLVESHQRKAVFLKESTRGLRNVRVLAGRAEQVGEQFDWLVSRAVSWADLKRSALRLAPRLALLVGASDVATLKADRLVRWAEPIHMPWGTQRSLLLGDVPRET